MMMKQKKKEKKKSSAARSSTYKKPRLISHGKLSLVMGMLTSTA